MRSIISCLSTELRSNGRGSSLSLEDLEIKEISVYKSAIETDRIKENLNINDRNAAVTSLAYQENAINSYFNRLVDSNVRCFLTCLFVQSQKWWLLFQCILKMGKNQNLVKVELSKPIKNRLRSTRFLSNHLRTSAKNYKDTHSYNNFYFTWLFVPVTFP